MSTLYVRLGNIMLNDRFYNEALSLFDIVIAQRPEKAAYYVARGVRRKTWRNIQEAYRDYNIAVKLDSSLADAYHNRVSARIGLKDFDGALKDMDKAITIKQERYGKAYLIRGNLKMDLKDYQGAKEDYNSALIP